MYGMSLNVHSCGTQNSRRAERFTLHEAIHLCQRFVRMGAHSTQITLLAPRSHFAFSQMHPGHVCYIMLCMLHEVYTPVHYFLCTAHVSDRIIVFRSIWLCAMLMDSWSQVTLKRLDGLDGKKTFDPP